MPIFTFINKMDREGRDPLDLMEEIEKLLGIHCVAANWPIGRGKELCGVFDRTSRKAILFTKSDARGQGSSTMGASRLARRSMPALCSVAYCGSGWWLLLVMRTSVTELMETKVVQA